jgi:putative hemolysin
MEFIVIILLILLNGVFAMYEIALVSSRRTRLEEKADEGNKGAARALKLLDHPQEFLSTIQIGITLIGIISGAYSGVAIAEHLTPFIAAFPALANLASFLSIAIVIAIVTYFSILVGELVPKSIALEHPETITIALTPFMRFMATITYPLVWVLSISTKALLKLFRLKPNSSPPFSEEEIRLMLKQGSESGVIDKHESEMITEVFRFGSKTAFSIMTPRIDIKWIDVNQPREETLQMIASAGYSKYPVCEGSVDKVIGIVAVKDILRIIEQEEEFNLLPILSETLFLPESQPASAVLDKFREKKIHIAIVVDEYGGTEGLITLHDLVEHILGDLPDLLDKEPPDYQENEDGTYIVNGSMNFWEFADLLDFPEMDDEEFEEESRQYSTVGGLAMHILGSVPAKGDTFAFHEFRFTIMEMDGKRVSKVHVTKPSA